MRIPRTLKEIWSIVKEADYLETVMSVLALIGMIVSAYYREWQEFILWSVIVLYAFTVTVLKVQIKHLKDMLLKEFTKRVTMLDVASKCKCSRCRYEKEGKEE